jgi:hypothetical protein
MPSVISIILYAECSVATDGIMKRENIVNDGNIIAEGIIHDPSSITPSKKSG